MARKEFCALIYSLVLCANMSVFKGTSWRCSCGAVAYSSRSALVHLSRTKHDVREHDIAVSEYDVIITQAVVHAPMPPAAGAGQNHLPIDQDGLEQNQLELPPPDALQHAPQALLLPELIAPAQEGPPAGGEAQVVAAVVPLGPPEISDYGPFANWSSMQLARLYADGDMSGAKMKQLQHLVNDPRFVGSEVNVNFLTRCNIRNVSAVIQHERLRYGLAAPVPFQSHEFLIDGICYTFFYRDLFAVALQLFTTSTTSKEDGFQYRAVQEFGENGRVFTSACTGWSKYLFTPLTVAGTVWQEAQLRHGVDVTIIPVRAYTDATNLTHMVSSQAKAHVGNDIFFEGTLRKNLLNVDRILRHSQRTGARAIDRRCVTRAVK